MIYVTLPDNRERRLTFYLAMEEYIARHMKGDEYFFMWQVTPTVIFGRNQLIQNEVNLEYCQQHNINTFRRKSGGGCVYADMNNIMFSYITIDENVSLTFGKYIDMVATMLRKLGVDATASGRIEGVGDIVVNMEMKNDVIHDIDIKGDFFLVGDIGQQIITPLRGVKLTEQEVAKALPNQLDDVILNLKKNDFVELLTK